MRCQNCSVTLNFTASWQEGAKKREVRERIEVNLRKAIEKFGEAYAVEDWRGVLKWEGLMEDIIEADGKDATRDAFLMGFARAHVAMRFETGGIEHGLEAVRLKERRIPLLGKMERFRDQGEEMCIVGQILFATPLEYFPLHNRNQQIASHYQRAREVGAAHGFFSVECHACLGLGMLAMADGRKEEGVELLRNALAAGPLVEHDEGSYETDAFVALTEAFLAERAFDDLEPLLPRYREAAEAKSRRMKKLSYVEWHSVYVTARLHEVQCILNPFTILVPCFHCR